MSIKDAWEKLSGEEISANLVWHMTELIEFIIRILQPQDLIDLKKALKTGGRTLAFETLIFTEINERLSSCDVIVNNCDHTGEIVARCFSENIDHLKDIGNMNISFYRKEIE